MIFLSILISFSVATYCFLNAMIIAGALSLLGMIPGLGAIPLLITSILLVINGHYITAFFPIIVIFNNILAAVLSRRG